MDQNDKNIRGKKFKNVDQLSKYFRIKIINVKKLRDSKHNLSTFIRYVIYVLLDIKFSELVKNNILY